MAQEKLKVCLYLQHSQRLIGSGLYSAVKNQEKALTLNKVAYTLDPKNQDYQILHTNAIFPGTRRIIKQARKKGKKIVIHAHTTAEDFKQSFIFSNQLAPLLHWWLNQFYALADVIICPSTYTKELLQKKYSKLKEKKMVVISNGIEIQKWHVDIARGEKFKQQYKIKSPLVFGVGLMLARKGVSDFIKVAKVMPQVNFMWIGRYFKQLTGGNDLRRSLRQRPDNFFTPGYVDDIIGAYTAGDIFLFPSYEENEGIVILEAAAMSKAIVVRDIPVFRSYLAPGQNCLMAKTEQEFITQVQKLIDDPDLRHRLGENAQKLAQQKSLQHVGKELKTLYQRLLQEPAT